MHITLNAMLLTPPFTGVELSILNLARALAQHGHHHYHFIIPSHCPESDISSPRFSTSRIRPPLPGRPGRILWEQLILPRRLRHARPDLLHAPGYVAPFLAPVPCVLTIYDLIALRHPEWCKRANHLHYRLLLPHSARHAAGIIVPSEATRRELLKLVPAAEPHTRVIPLGVPAEFRELPDTTVRPVLDRLGLQPPFLLFVGQMEPKKNIPVLLEAYHQLKTTHGIEHKLVIAGNRGWRCREIDAAVQRFGLADVLFTGYVSTNDLAALYNAADLFVFPSLYEGFGLPPLEAMACGVPVVCSDRGALPEVTGDAAEVVSDLTPAGLAAAVHHVLTTPDRRRTLIANGLRRAPKFTWQSTARQTEDFYESCVNSIHP